MGNILGDPFALATISVALLAWVITFIALIVSQINVDDQTPALPALAWWAAAYSIVLVIGVFVVVASDSVQTYHVALTSYLSAMLVLVTISVNSLIYTSIGSRQAGAAGFILLSMVTVIWIFYFGSTPSSTPRAFVDSFALAKESSTMHRSTMNGYGGGRPETSNSVQPPQMYTSAQLNGFENPSPVGGISQVNGSRGSAMTPVFAGGSQVPSKGLSPGADAEVVPPTEYPYRAKAIYSYEANPDDANEISFTKHEVLEVSDVSGRWWQARKETGETGIAPSNYLILL
jgi:SHO1 osmosensor